MDCVFLTNRHQRVFINNEVSDYMDVKSGVPQGSVLGPLLFIVFINDISDNVNSTCKIFADDTKIYSSSKNSHILQDDLNNILEWSRKWQLYFNISKCKVMHIGKNNPKHVYHINDNMYNVLNSTDSERDLGVMFDCNLNFDVHINTCVTKASKMIGIINRSFVYMNTMMFLTMYKSIIRPLLEYGNCIWSPLFKRQSIVIENVQRRATKLIPIISEWSYVDRLRYLKLPSLKYRRQRGDLIQLYKIVAKIKQKSKRHPFRIYYTFVDENQSCWATFVPKWAFSFH